MTVDNAVIYYHKTVKESILLHGLMILSGFCIAVYLMLSINITVALFTFITTTSLTYHRYNKCRRRLYMNIINMLRGGDVPYFFRFIEEDVNMYLEEMR
jgi:hypothetical protein